MFSLMFAAAMNMAPVVGAANPTSVTEGEPRSYVGTIKASERVSITARVTGTIWKQNFKEGGLVNEGDTLFEIEDTIYKANLRTAKAKLAALEAQLVFAEKEVKRYEQCLEKKSVSESDYDRAVQTRDVLKADKEAAEAAVILAENDIFYTKVVCPVGGIIGETKIRLGNNVSPQSGELVSVVKYDPIQIQFSLSEADYFKAFHGGTLKGSVKMDLIRADGEKITKDVKVDFVDNSVDRTTGTIMVQLECANPDRELVPGGYVKVLLTELYNPPVLAVPTSAMLYEGENKSVYKVVDGIAQKCPVQIGKQIGNLQLISEGVSAEDVVIVTGTHKVQPDKPVTVK